MSVAAAVLAAGAGRRLGAPGGAGGVTPKPLLELLGRPLVAHALDAARGSGCEPVLLVVGHRGAEVGAAAPGDVEVVVNAEWEEGIASSLRAVLRALDARPVGAVVVGLADQPLVSAEAYRRVAASYAAGARLAVATYGGMRANPVLLGRAHWREAAALTGDEGARRLFARHAVVEVPCDGAGDPTDIDTTDDLDALEAACRSRTASG
jgi:CTP:molybdopterin cytidylyltransferase MocA